MRVDKVIYGRLAGNAAVSALVGTRIYPMHPPQGATFPRITYEIQAYWQGSSTTLSGPSGVGHYWVQVDCWSRTHEEAIDLADKVSARKVDGGPLDGFMGIINGVTVQNCIRRNTKTKFEESKVGEDVGAYQVSMDYEVILEE